MRLPPEVPANENKQSQRPGGRAAAVVAAVRQATLALLNENGYEKTEIPEIAARAQVNKTSIYRRWSTKAELILDVALSVMQADVPVPNTGNLKDDLTMLLHDIRHMLATPFAGGLLQALVAADRSDSAILAARTRFWSRRFEISGKLVENAIIRKELPPNTDVRHLLEVASAPLYFRHLMTAERITDEFIDSIVTATLKAFGAKSR